MPDVNARPFVDEYGSTDEVRVYKEEGEVEGEHCRDADTLSEDKLGLVTETEEVGLHAYNSLCLKTYFNGYIYNKIFVA